MSAVARFLSISHYIFTAWRGNVAAVRVLAQTGPGVLAQTGPGVQRTETAPKP